jgi:RNA recognition motif-containing protein
MENKRVFMGNLDFAVTEEEIRTLLSGYGTVVHIKIHKKKGCAFVEMSDEAEAAQAIEKLNGTEFKGREVRISLEIKASKAKTLSIKKYKERKEGFSRQKKSDNPDNGSQAETDHDSVKTESDEKPSGFEDKPADEYRKNNTEGPRHGRSPGHEKNYNSRERYSGPDDRPAGNYPKRRFNAPHPQRREWSEDKPAYSNRSTRDGQKSDRGRTPGHETNYNSRERFSGPDDRPLRSRSPRGSDSPHPQRKEWSHDRPAYSNRPSRDDKKPGRGRTPGHETNYNSRERFSGPDDRPLRGRSPRRSDSPHPQRKEWSHDRPPYSSRPSRDDKKPGRGRTPGHETNYNSRERFSGPDDRPPRSRAPRRSDSPHPQRKEWSHDRPAYSGRPAGPSQRPGARTRDVFKPQPAGGSPKRGSSSTGPKSGAGGKSRPANSAGPKARGGAGTRDRNSRPKRD